MSSSASPSFPEGSLILIEPESYRLSSGKYYLSRHSDGEIAFRQYVLECGQGYLVPLNTSFRIIELCSSWQIIGQVIDVKITGL